VTQVAQAFSLCSVMAAVLSFQLFIPPIIGLADQGDYARIIGRFGYGPQAKTFQDRYYGFLNRTYIRDPTFRAKDWESPTSQYLLTGLAVLLAGDTLDIRLMGAIHAAVFLLAAYSLLRPLRPRQQKLAGLALIVIFCDVGYISYFNSFFTEPASFLFLFCLLAAWVWILMRGVTFPALLAWSAAALLWTTAKLQNVPLGLMLAAYLVRLGSLLPTRKQRFAIGAAALILTATSITLYVTAPQSMKDSATYDMLFLGILPQTPDVDKDLRAFGLDPALREYSGTGAWSPKTAFSNPQIMESIRQRVSPFSIALFYAQRPTRLWKLTETALPKAISLRAEFSGNYERRWGYPPLARSHAWALWSRFRESVLGRFPLALLLFLAAGIPYAYSRPRTLVTECYIMLSAMALVAFGIVVLGDAWDMTKHFFIFNVLADVCLVTALIAAAVVGQPILAAAAFPGGILQSRRHHERSPGNAGG
jgi:hypothetical protein